MRLKANIIVSSLLVLGMISPVFAMTPEDSTSEKYILDHGHSKEIVRMINLQKSRTEGTGEFEAQKHGQFVNFLRNIWFDQDVSASANEFGCNYIRTVETDKELFPKKEIIEIKSLVDINKNKKKLDDNEVMINEIRVRDGE